MKKYSSLRLGKKGNISFLLDKQATMVVLILFLLLMGLFLFSIAMGDIKINVSTVVKTLFGFGPEMETLVIQTLRLPRIIIAILVGMALAVSGGILQGIIRNPLASPDIIGLTGGAAAFVVMFLALFSNESNALMVSIKWMPVAAFIGATIIGVMVYLLAYKNGVSPIRLVLIGIGVSALAQAVTTTLMVMGPIYQASQANIWITGSVYASTWQNVQILVPIVLILITLTIILARNLNIQELGEELATGVGSAVQKQRFLLLLISTALTGSAVAFAGGIGFVGLMAPHMARRLVGSSFGALLPTAAFIGGILVMGADLIGRTLFLPLQVPAGVFTAAIGAPYFIYLLYRSRNL